MRAIMLTDTRTIEVKEVDEPAHGDTDVLIEMRAGGICGSDMHAYRGFHPFRRPPVVLGHEGAGVVIEVGSAIKDFAVGDRVAIEPQITCGRCPNCLRGFSNFCAYALRPGMPGWTGFLANRVRAPEKVLYKLADSTSYAEGAMIEPATVAYRAFRRGEVAMGMRVAVLGVGAIGSVFAHLCQQTRVSQLMVTDVKDYNLAFVSSLGDCHTVNAAESDVQGTAAELTDGEGFDLVAVTSGATQSLVDALNLCSPRGVVVLIAIYPEHIPFDGTRAVYREAEVRPSFCYTRDDFAGMTELINRGLFDLKPFITRRVPLEHAPELFQAIEGGLDHVKVIFDIGSGDSERGG